MILCAGGVVANFVLVPLISMIGGHVPGAVYPGIKPIGAMAASEIFRFYVRYVGVGAIATAGIFGIIKSLRVIGGSFGIALKAFRHGEAHVEDRTDRDIPVMTQLIGVAIGAVGVAVFFGTLRPTAMALTAYQPRTRCRRRPPPAPARCRPRPRRRSR